MRMRGFRGWWSSFLHHRGGGGGGGGSGDFFISSPVLFDLFPFPVAKTRKILQGDAN